MSKKVKKGKPFKVVLHPSKDWEKTHYDEAEDPIGDMVIYREPVEGVRKDYLMARVSLPFKSYETILAYLTHKVGGRIQVVGTEIEKRKSSIYYVSFDSKSRS